MTFTLGQISYAEQPCDELMTLLGAERVFGWKERTSGKIGYVVLRGESKVPLCSCPVNLCVHRAEVKGYLNMQAWEPPAPRPAA